MGMSPRDLLNKVRASANLDSKDYEKQIAIKLNKAGKIKFQLLALDSEYLFKSRIQHFIPKLPDSDDSNEKILVVDCQGENCPICDAAIAFKNSGVTLDAVNETYKSKYPYQNLRSVFTQPEHFIVGARVLADNADDGTYLPKDAALGSTQLLQLSKTALTNLMSAYEDFIDDYDGDAEELPPLFGVFEDGVKTVKSFTVNLRITTQPMWSYTFSLGKAVEAKLEEVDVEKLKLLQETVKPTDDYMEKAIKRIRDIQNYFVGGSSSKQFDTTVDDDYDLPFSDKDNLAPSNNISEDDDDFDLDTL